MGVLEAEAEREKSQKIKVIASRGAAIAREVGQDPQVVSTFLDHYFRHVDATDIDERSVEDLLGLVESHFRLALERKPGQAAVRVFDPQAESPADSDGDRQADSGSAAGWGADGATVVEIVTDDHPFLVDSVTMEVTRQGWSLHEVFHPQFYVHRDDAGRLQQVLTAGEAERDRSVLAESWMHLEVTPPPQDEQSSDCAGDLADGLREVVRNVQDAVADWDTMRERAIEIVATLEQDPPPVDPAEVSDATELLRWLSDNHFTFLGYRRYDLSDRDSSGPDSSGPDSSGPDSSGPDSSGPDSSGPDSSGPDSSGAGSRPRLMSPVAGTGLGILRSDATAEQSFDAIPLSGNGDGGDRQDDEPLVVITKDDERSRVHRPSYLDYIGVRRFDDEGRITGEDRFLGLLASTAYSEAVIRIPVVRAKAQEVLRRSGYDPESHGGKAVMDVLDTYPRDELFQTSVDELSPVVEKIAHLKERRQVRFFYRREPYGRYVSCLVFLPRDRYTTDVRTAMEGILLDVLGGESIDYTARVSESVLARLHFVVRMPRGEPVGTVDVDALEARLTRASRTWDDVFTEQITEQTTDRAGRRQRTSRELMALMHALPEGYKEDYTPRQAVQDLEALSSLRAGSEMELALFKPEHADDEADLRLKIFRRQASLSLSLVLPHLSLLGVDVIDERPYELHFPDDRRAFVYDFGLRVPGGAEAVGSRWTPHARELFMAAFRASYDDRSESDAYNRLVLAAGLDWRQVSLLRTIGHYLRQAGNSYSQTYIASVLSANVDIARLLIAMFATKFNPEETIEQGQRESATREVAHKIQAALDDVASLDHDRILRSLLAVVNAAVRTNFYQPDSAEITLKLLPRKIPGLPEPRPAFEIWVHSPRVEGVHLRFGAVARGGLRWSDRAEDFRTEILGLVKAQMVKNTVIVPVGAKGGFFAKRLPDPSLDRDAWMAEGVASYQLFISALLDVTDNIVDGKVVPPDRTVRYDTDDPYLVVAADKGTATFSDIANQLAIDKGFWLGDAFASGGSAGYDHKEMGITARGAWESVVRHFRELGLDCQSTDFSCVGVGDMSGDVFGNGMLLSKHTKLVAAFDHRHVFLDPDPDPAASWTERRRMFELPRSSWADYDREPDLRRWRNLPADGQVHRDHAPAACGAGDRGLGERAVAGRSDHRHPEGAGRPALERRHRDLRQGRLGEQRRRRGQGQRPGPDQRSRRPGPVRR